MKPLSNTAILVLALHSATNIYANEPISLWQDASESGEIPDDGIAVQQQSDVRISTALGALYHFDTDIDGGNNDFSVSRVAGSLSFDTTLTETSRVGIAFGYDVSSYDFGGTSGFYAGNPWDDIHTFTAGAIFQFDLNNDWTLFGGPTVQFASESGADFGDGVTGGGLIGASWKASDRLVIGGGLGVTSQIEDNARVFPIVRVEWAINDRWSLTSRAQGNLITPTFLQLGYQATDTLKLSIGGGYFFRRFALDDGPLAPGGVGEDEAFAFNIAARWTPSANITLLGLVGSSIGGQLTTESTAGVVLAEQDYDPGLFIGGVVSIRF